MDTVLYQDYAMAKNQKFCIALQIEYSQTEKVFFGCHTRLLLFPSKIQFFRYFIKYKKYLNNGV